MPRQPLPADTIRTMIRDGISVPDVARAIGAHPKSVWKACKQHNIPVPLRQRIPPAPKVAKPIAPKPRTYAEIMATVWFEDDPAACRPMIGKLPSRGFEWRSAS